MVSCGMDVSRARTVPGPLSALQKIGKYELIKELGKGATSVGVPGLRPVPEPPGRHQGGVSRGARRQGARQALPQALHHRGVARRQAFPSPHRRHLRRGGGRGGELHRDGVRGRHHARAVHAPRHPAAGAAHRRNHLQVRAGAGVRVQPGRHPPRHQARQHPSCGRIGHQDLGFRRGVDARPRKPPRCPASARRPTCRRSR